MMQIPLTADDDHIVFLAAAIAMGKMGEPVDAHKVIEHMDCLFDTYEFYDNHETEYDHVINTSGVVPEKPGKIRDRMWKWIERTSKKLHHEIDVEGSSGEYIYLVGGDWSITEYDFDTNNNGDTIIGEDLAEKIHILLKFRAEWFNFAAKLEGRHKKRG